MYAYAKPNCIRNFPRAHARICINAAPSPPLQTRGARGEYLCRYVRACICVSSASGQDHGRARCYPEVAKSIGMTRGHAAGFRDRITDLPFGIGRCDEFMLLASVTNRCITPRAILRAASFMNGNRLGGVRQSYRLYGFSIPE